MLKIEKISKKYDREMEDIIRDCLIEFELDIPGTAWEDPYLGELSGYYENLNGDYFIAIIEEKDEDDDGNIEVFEELAGGCGYGPLSGVDGTCELQKLYLREDFRGLGIAKDLLETIEKEAKVHYKKIYLETAENMDSAIKFYEKNGYKRLCSPLGATGHTSCGTFFIKDL